MAKFYGNIVKTGKLGGSVFTVRNGVTIEKQYQPIVADPNTPAQIEARAKFKLLTQVATILGPVIAITRNGLVSARNRFLAENYNLTTYTSNVADVDITKLQITKSSVGMSNIAASRSGESVYVSTGSGLELNRVVFVALTRGANSKVRFAGSAVANAKDGQGRFTVEFPGITAESYYLAYGVRDNTEAAKVYFGNITVDAAQVMAKIVVSRTLLESDITLTETVGTHLAAAE